VSVHTSRLECPVCGRAAEDLVSVGEVEPRVAEETVAELDDPIRVVWPTVLSSGVRGVTGPVCGT